MLAGGTRGRYSNITKQAASYSYTENAQQIIISVKSVPSNARLDTDT